MLQILGVDIETYSSAPLPKCGVYRYADSPDFEILLFSYAYDDGPINTIDLTRGETLPKEILAALADPEIIKMAWNAQFERVCLSKHLGRWLDPSQWRCTAVMGAYLTLPARLADAAISLNLTQQKMDEGKDLIRYFSVPCKPSKANGGRTRNLPVHAPDRWETYKAYNAQDVEVERAVRKALEPYPLPAHEWELYALDQRINDRGVRVDRLLVKQAMRCDEAFSRQGLQRAKELTGVDNPGSVAQLKVWLADQDMPMESLAKKIVQEKAKSTDGVVSELLNLRLELAKTSVKKYEAMARTLCKDGRVHGMFRFYGASRTGRFASQLVNLQNIAQNHLPDLALARDFVKAGDADALDMLFGSIPNALSELIRTALIPKEGHRFIVADFSAIEARVLAWLAGEEWVLDEFRGNGKIYEATASRMFHVPIETIVKGHENYLYRQKGKVANLACGFGGGVGALKNMGANIPHEEMQSLVNTWRGANQRIVKLWNALDAAAQHVVENRVSARVGKVRMFWKDDKLFIQLPSGRRLCYLSPRFVENRFGGRSIGYLSAGKSGELFVEDTWGGKLSENCMAAGTLVLTNAGLKPIEQIEASHLIWDGEAFVRHGGLICKGVQMTIRLGNLYMTPEHKILTEKGWVQSVESHGFNWATVSLPDGFVPGKEQSPGQSEMARSVFMRKRKGCRRGRYQTQASSNAIMRMHEKDTDFEGKYKAWHVGTSRFCSMAFHVRPLSLAHTPGVSKLWRPWYYGLRCLGEELRKLLEGYGANIQKRSGVGQDQQRFRVQPGELQMGYPEGKHAQQKGKPSDPNAIRADDRFGAVRENRNRSHHNAVSDQPWLADRIVVHNAQCAKPVYDIRNCGPRHRFAVWDGQRARVVSNCTQAIARDLLAHAMMSLDKAGYAICMHVHDEIVAEMPVGQGSVEEACAIMGQVPDWAEGLPLNAEGYECLFYQKS